MSYIQQKQWREREKQEKKLLKEQAEIISEIAGVIFKGFCMVGFLTTAAILGYYYNNMVNARNTKFFSLPDSCGTFEKRANRTMYAFSLSALENLPEMVYPSILRTTLPTIDFNRPMSWIGGGNVIYKVDNDWWVIAVDSDMSGISGQHLRKWFDSANCTDMYQWWHPLDHKYGIWLKRDSDAKELGGHGLVARAGYTHRVVETIGGSASFLDIQFRDPCQERDCHELQEEGVELILSADITSHEIGFGLVKVGTFVHTLRVAHGRSTLHSRFFIGREIQCMGDMSWRCTLFEIFSPITKKLILSEKKVKAIYKHCKEEMTVLGKVIQRLY